MEDIVIIDLPDVVDIAILKIIRMRPEEGNSDYNHYHIGNTNYLNSCTVGNTAIFNTLNTNYWLQSKKYRINLSPKKNVSICYILLPHWDVMEQYVPKIYFEE